MMAISPKEQVQIKFRDTFGGKPDWTVRAPGRVNLIGEHTDYNEGFVLPMAIDRSVWIALRPRVDSEVNILSIDFTQKETFSLDTLQKGQNTWVEYIKGVAWALMENGYQLKGWDGILAGNIPIGAGLSSSAAAELAGALAFSLSSNFEWDAKKMAQIAQEAENKWVGVSSGIMDQMISACGVQGNALLIDCRSLDTKLAPLPSGTSFVILDTGTRRELVGSAYNERRAQCETAAKAFNVPALRDVAPWQFRAGEAQLNPLIAKRARHIISENERTLQAAQAMKENNAIKTGHLMDESHESLRDDFEVSSDALDVMVEVAQQHEGCFGARMTGGGFGGCAVALVESSALQNFSGGVSLTYQTLTGIEPKIYVCRAENGAEVIPNEAR